MFFIPSRLRGIPAPLVESQHPEKTFYVNVSSRDLKRPALCICYYYITMKNLYIYLLKVSLIKREPSEEGVC